MNWRIYLRIALLTAWLGAFSIGNYCLSAFAEKDVHHDLHAWQTVTLQLPVSERFQLNIQSQTRLKNGLSEAQQLQQFVDLNYFLDKSKHWSLGAGYVWTPTFSPSFINENRVYQVVGFQHPIKQGRLTIRNRFEERFIKHASDVAYSNVLLIQYMQPLKKFPTWYLSMSDEVLVNFNQVKHGPKAGLDQQRVYLMLGKHLSEHIRLEGGYMLQFQPRRNNTTLNHTLMTQMIIH